MSYKNRLGNKCWNFLHTLAEGFPPLPNKDEIEAFKIFMDKLADIYPCRRCKFHMKEYFARFPPFPSKRYLCNFHNNVNLRLGKNIFKCE